MVSLPGRYGVFTSTNTLINLYEATDVPTILMIIFYFSVIHKAQVGLKNLPAGGDKPRPYVKKALLRM